MICIVEDNDPMRFATTALVRSMGREVCAFSCAEQYLASKPDPRPACLIVDVHMPGMDGFELQSVLAASGDLTPIIFMTGFPDDQLRSRAFDCGAVAFLAKPFSNEALYDGIAAALRAPNRRVDGN